MGTGRDEEMNRNNLMLYPCHISILFSTENSPYSNILLSSILTGLKFQPLHAAKEAKLCRSLYRNQRWRGERVDREIRMLQVGR